MKKISITLAHAGKQHSYQVAKAMKKLEVLQRFYTSSYISSSVLQRVFRNQKWLQRRFISGVTGSDVEANWRFEFKEQFTRLTNQKISKFREAVYNRDAAFDAYLAKKIPQFESDMFWGFQGSCNNSLKAAKESGKIAVCELATAHVVEAKKILSEESRLHPEWEHTIDNFEFPAWYEKRLEQEPQEADWVIAASQFTRQSLLNSDIDGSKIKLLPLGFDLDNISFDVASIVKKQKHPLRLLYVGRITQRKGIKYLLEAMKVFSKSEVELHIIGNVNNGEEPLKKYKQVYTLHPAVSQHEMYKAYQAYDALVLPSVFEGFGLVIVEAMAAGLPVITTPNTFGPEIIEDDKNGYIVPIRNISAIEEAIKKLLDKSEDELEAMRHSARSAALNFSWEAYQKRLQSVLEDITS